MTDSARTLSLKLEGMSCASCVRRIEQALQKAGGVIEANVNFATEKASVTYNPEQVEAQDLIKIIVKAGYQASVAGSERVTLSIQGMSCASCVRRIEKALVKVRGVQNASVNFATEQVAVEYDASLASLAAIKQAIGDAGYQVTEAEPELGEDRERAAREQALRRLTWD